MRTLAVLVSMAFGVLAFGQGQSATPEKHQRSKAQHGPYERPSSARPDEGKEDFFHFATKEVNPHDTDWGAWIEQRRQAFLEAMAANPFFWYSAFTTGLLMTLLVAFGVRIMDEKRKLWHAAEILTDVWNQEQYSQFIAQTATEKYNRHMLDCNRVIEAQVSGRSSPAMFEASDAKEQLERLRAERDNLDSDNRRLKAELEKHDGIIRNLSTRVKDLEPQLDQNGSGVSQAGGLETERKLIAKVNQLRQELEAEKQKNRSLKGA
jgi:hypothetical protein